MEPREREDERRDDPVEGGALEDEGTDAERPPAQEQPVESGGLEEEQTSDAR